MGSQVGIWNRIPSGILGGIGRIPGGILLFTVSFESLRLGNLDNPCKTFVGIPQGIPGGIPSEIPNGILGGILERDPMWDPRWDREDPRWDFNSPNIFYICLVYIGIPNGISIPAGILIVIPKTSLCQNFQGGISG